MQNYYNFNHNAIAVFSFKSLVEFDLIGKDESKIGFFDLYIISPPLSTTRASYQTLIVCHPNPSKRG